ncbi:MAG: bifunctional oligoribonuclease/PAP phosphatase NrnA [Treponema sp.]|jgi:phosphoesterase RecJ-like protein|nr:bifunctional oligoribonuclease/PAP phosphatase NrnA [Treponema sp.]
MDSGIEIKDIPDELVSFINTGSKFIIAGHKEPDGDCVGSQLALRSALLRLGKEAVSCSAGPFKRAELKDFTGQFTDFRAFQRDNSKSHDIRVIVVDCSAPERMGDLHELFEKYNCAIIDHHAAASHPLSTSESPVFVDASSPSCTLIIEKLITALGLKLTPEEAELLLFGLCTDTGFFRHLTEKNSAVFESAAKMVRHGANPKSIYNTMHSGKSLESRILLGHILSRTESHFDGRLIISHETLEEFKKYGFEGRDSENLNKLLLSIEGTEATAVIRQESNDNCTVSLRSVDKIDVAKIAVSFGGGGHKNAAGLTMQGNISTVKQNILETFSKIFIS